MPAQPTTLPNPQPFCTDYIKTGAPTNPPAGSVRVYADSGTGLLTAIDSSGNDAISGVSNAVTAVSPGAGIAHFAGGTNVATSSPVNLASATEVTGVLPAANLPGGINSTTVLLNTAALLALPATPFAILAAPATGKMIVPISVTYDYKFLTTAFTLGNADNVLVLIGHGKTVPIVSAAAAGLVDQTANTFVVKSSVTTNQVRANFAALGLDLQIQGTTPALTLGLGSLSVTVTYYTVTLA